MTTNRQWDSPTAGNRGHNDASGEKSHLLLRAGSDDDLAQKRLGLFVSGFRWSGSSAVADWLRDFERFAGFPGSKRAYGEVRALNYGVRNLARTAESYCLCGEQLGRYALCPDRRLRSRILGRALNLERAGLGLVLRSMDLAFTVVARAGVTPPFSRYPDLLHSQLGRDFRGDEAYLHAVAEFAGTLRRFVRKNRRTRARSGPAVASARAADDPGVRRTASRLVALFYDRLVAARGRLPVFDNVFSGQYPGLFDLISPEIFRQQVILFVTRDPRDQFVELVRYSPKNFAFQVKRFVAQYRRDRERAARFVGSRTDNWVRFVRMLPFEAFVASAHGEREALAEELARFWAHSGIQGCWSPKRFKASRSMQNIGVWKSAGLRRQVRYITQELSEYLRPEAD